ncbi:MAG: hypothetical protein ACI4FX_03710 [Agathobacter sp.]
MGDLLAPVPAQIRSQAITVKGGLETDSTQKETVDTKLQIEGIEFDKKELSGPLTGTEEVTATATLKGEANYKLQSIDLMFRNENGQSLQAYNSFYSDENSMLFSEDGTCTVQAKIYGLDQYTGNGTYSLEDAYINVQDKDGQISYEWWNSYNKAGDVDWDDCESLTVRENCSDVTAPVISSLSVDKTSISGSGKLHITAKVTDGEDGSGVGDSIQIALSRDGISNRNFQYISLEYNENSGLYEADVLHTSDAIEGTYEVVVVNLVDRAGNGVYYYGEDANNPLPENLKCTIKVTNGAKLIERASETVPSNIVVNDDDDTVTFTAAENVSYEYCRLYEGEKLNTASHWNKVEGTGTTRTIKVGNDYIAANSIYIRSCETPIYAAGQKVAVEKPFTWEEKLKGNITVTGSPVAGGTLTINAGEITGLENGDELVYNFLVSEDGVNTYYYFHSGASNTLTITRQLIGKYLQAEQSHLEHLLTNRQRKNR